MGSQVTLSSLGNQTRLLLDEQARHLLNEQERATMAYYLEEYRGGSVSVEALVMALFELLNTHAKVPRTPPRARQWLPRALHPPSLPLSPTPFPRTRKELGGNGPGAETSDRGGRLSQGRQPRDSWGNSQLTSPVMRALTKRLSLLSIHLESSGFLFKSHARAPPQAGGFHTSAGGSRPQAPRGWQL